MFCRFRTLLTYSLPLILLVVVLLGVPQVTLAAGWFANTVWNVVVSFFGMLAGWGGGLLNFAVTHYVVGFGAQFNSDIGAVTNQLWLIVRDIFNITFIFGLVYIGFKMILDSGNTDTRRWLASLILAALLVNFSLFITKFVVEISNQLSAQIVTAGFDFKDGSYLISDAFMDRLGVQGLFQLDANAIDETINSPWAYIFGTAILLLVMAFVFASGAILLVIRYAVLIIYMILSPLMFLGSVFPQMRSYTSQYWRGFLGRAFFAPIYLLLVYLSLRVISSFYTGGGPSMPDLLSSGTKGFDAFGATLPPFILSVVFLIASLVIANKLGAQGASTALRIGSNIRGRTQRAVQRGGYAALRGTTYPARALAGVGARKGSYALGASLDRNLERAQQSKNRFVSGAANSVVATDAVQGAANKAKNAKFGRQYTKEQARARETQIEDSTDVISEYEKGRKAYQEAKVDYEAAEKMEDGEKKDKDMKDAKDKMRTAENQVGTSMRRMSVEQLKRRSLSELTSPEVAKHLSEANLKLLKDSGVVKRDDVKKLKDARETAVFKPMEDTLESTTASIEELSDTIADFGKTVRDFSGERLTGLHPTRLKDERFAAHLTSKQLEELQNSGKFSAADMDDIKSSQKRGLNGLINGGTYQTANGKEGHLISKDNKKVDRDAFAKQERSKLITNRSAQEAGQLPVAVFTNPDMAEHLTPQVLEQRMRNGQVSEDDKKTIEANVAAHLNKSTTPDNARKQWQTWTKNSTYGAGFDFGSENKTRSVSDTVAMVEQENNNLNS